MNRDDLYDAITNIREDLVEEAQNHVFSNPGRKWKRFLSMAAVFALVIGAGSFGLFLIFGGAGAGGGGTAHEPGQAIRYMSYAGPVFPLENLSDAGGITAARNTDFDFSPYISRTETSSNGDTYASYSSHAVITDSYLLTNTTAEDLTVELAYPFAASLDHDAQCIPSITANGEILDAQLRIGPYSGSFEGVWGRNDPDGSVNLDYIDSWEGYQALLSDGSYRDAAFSEMPTLDLPVTVYRVDNYAILDTDTEDTNPTLAFEFQIGSGTIVMSYNANGGRNDYETGHFRRSTSDLDNTYLPPQPMYIVLAGEDLLSYTIQGYMDGGCDKGEEMEIAADVTRYETTLDQFLWDRVQHEPWVDREYPTVLDYVSKETLLGCIAELYVSYGVLSDDPVERYDFGMMEDMIFEAQYLGRVLYLSFEVTIPAGQTLEISASMVKEASFDYYGNGVDCHGYDMMTTLGSDLVFTEQTASISGTDEITILSQNFGFDPENGITKVTLDPAQPHYWLEVYKKEEN